MSKAVFITGTDTEIGKRSIEFWQRNGHGRDIATGGLLRHLDAAKLLHDRRCQVLWLGHAHNCAPCLSLLNRQVSMATSRGYEMHIPNLTATARWASSLTF